MRDDEVPYYVKGVSFVLGTHLRKRAEKFFR
jgi:hypothetical protein